MRRCDLGHKTGSHNLVIGVGHRHPSAGGPVAGWENAVTGGFATVAG